jgi:hypothetical protein
MTEPSNWTAGLTDEDFRGTMLSALRLLAILSVFAIAFFWLKFGWQSAALFLIGAIISAASLWEWLRLMTAVMERMDATPDPNRKSRPMGLILFNFFLRLGLTVVVLYVSLKYLNGTVFALAAGLGLGVFSLTVEAIRLMKRWTV